MREVLTALPSHAAMREPGKVAGSIGRVGKAGGSAAAGKDKRRGPPGRRPMALCGSACEEAPVAGGRPTPSPAHADMRFAREGVQSSEFPLTREHRTRRRQPPLPPPAKPKQ